jgi:hypothetical protein
LRGRGGGLAKADARTAAVFRNELDAGRFENSHDGSDVFIVSANRTVASFHPFDGGHGNSRPVGQRLLIHPSQGARRLELVRQYSGLRQLLILLDHF